MVAVDEAALRQRQKTTALKFLARELSNISWCRQQCEAEAESEQAAKQAAAVLPSGEMLEKIMRYETRLERQYSAKWHNWTVAADAPRRNGAGADDRGSDGGRLSGDRSFCQTNPSF